MRQVFLFFALLVLGPVFSHAQSAPTLTSADVVPNYGDAFLVYNCNAANVLPGPSGADTSWDFSSLTVLPTGGSDTGTAVPAAYTQNFSKFSGSNLAIVDPPSTLTVYYASYDSVLALNGLYSAANQYTVYSDPMDQLQFPFTYSNTFTDTYDGIVVYSTGGSPVTAANSGQVIVTADAYGTLTLPGLSGNRIYQNTLRVHSLQNYIDSAEVSGHASTPQNFTLETYTWYWPGYHNALLTIAITSTSAGIINKQVSYTAKQLAGTNAVASVTQAATSAELFPNPTTGNLNISYSNPGATHLRITLADMMGRQVATIADTNPSGTFSTTYNTEGLQAGIYLVRFQANSGVVTKRVVVE